MFDIFIVAFFLSVILCFKNSFFYSFIINVWLNHDVILFWSVREDLFRLFINKNKVYEGTMTNDDDDFVVARRKELETNPLIKTKLRAGDNPR